VDEVPESLADQLMSECSLSNWDGSDGCCRWCGEDITSSKRWRWCSNKCRLAFERNHIWKKARSAAKRSAKYRCTVDGCDIGGRGALDVHHLNPRNGRGYGPGCHAHQDNLAVLCKDHHKAETARERLALKGTIKKRNAAAIADPADKVESAVTSSKRKPRKRSKPDRKRVRGRGKYAALIPQIDFSGNNS